MAILFHWRLPQAERASEVWMAVAAAKGKAKQATTFYFLEQPDFLKLRLHGGFTWGTEAMAAGSRGQTEAWRLALDRLRSACQRCIEAGVFVDRDPGLIARTIVAMQQVELANWLEGGMTTDRATVADALEEQVERTCRIPSATH